MSSSEHPDVDDFGHSRIEYKDRLTGAWSRAAWTEALEREVARAKRHARPLSVIVFKINDFISINEKQGHSVGDEVLRGVAIFVDAKVRTYDLLGRLGDGEFGLVLPETPEIGAVKLAERIRSLVAHIRFDQDSEVAVTVSLGAVEFSDHASSAEILVERAHEAVLAAR